MRLPANERYTDVIESGNGLLVTPDNAALVSLLFPDNTAAQQLITYPKRFGPYVRDVRVAITALSGACVITEAIVPESLQTEGWDDLRFPAQGINPAGAANAPTVDTTLTGYPGTLLFSGSQDNIIAGVAQLPHAWKRGSTVYPHIHWSKPTGSADAVTWVMYYRVLGSVGETHAALTGPVAATAPLGDPTVENSMLLTSFGALDLTGQKESTCIAWQIRRLGSSDADNNAVRFFEFDIHYQSDKTGTTTQIPD